MKRIRILPADDHTLVCEGFRKLLEPEFEVVGTVGDGRALLKAAEELKPDLVLVDIGMPLLNGLDAARQLKKAMPRLKIMFLTTPIAVEVFQDQIRLSPCSPYLFASDENPSGHQKTLKTVWRATLQRAGIPYFRIYDLRSTYATRLGAGGVADEWVTQLLRPGDAKVFKKYSQMKLQMKPEALIKLNREANEQELVLTQRG